MLMTRFDRAPDAVDVACADGIVLSGHYWSHKGSDYVGVVVVNPATGVLASYYHRYAAFLTEHGFDVLTYDYRGIGLSRPPSLRGCGFRWRDWGMKDFDAALNLARLRSGDRPVFVVGHSFGGVAPGLAEGGPHIHRMLTVGAQYAYWRDYASDQRVRLLLKWHVFMPVMTALYGYFPGKRLGWLEDLPAGVANEWSRQRDAFELIYPADERENVLRRFRSVTAPILAVTVSDDELGTPRAVQRTLAYYRSAKTEQVLLSPADVGDLQTGHFGLFHSRHAAGFWIDTVLWLREGTNPWPDKRLQAAME